MRKLVCIACMCAILSVLVACNSDEKDILPPPIDKVPTDTFPTLEPIVDPLPDKAVIQPTIADSSFTYYNKAFLLKGKDSKDGYNYYRENETSDHWAYFWNQALIILMVEDRYECMGDESVKLLINELLNAFLIHEKNTRTNDITDWTWNEFQDDLLWAGLAFIRGYKITGNPRFLAQARWDWEFLYNRGYDNQLGGGLWWDIRKGNKSGLSNNPAVSMACYLYEATKEKIYLQRAKEIYEWIYNTLREPDGAIDENISKDGKKTNSYNIYNIGAFIEAANALYRVTKDESYAEDAKTSIQFVMHNKVNEKGIMSKWHRDGTWQSEFARGMGMFVKENNLWNYQADYTADRKPITYYEWMRMNALAAWRTHNANNLTFNEWGRFTPLSPEPGKVWTALEMLSAVVMTQVTPETTPQ